MGHFCVQFQLVTVLFHWHYSTTDTPRVSRPLAPLSHDAYFQLQTSQNPLFISTKPTKLNVYIVTFAASISLSRASRVRRLLCFSGGYTNKHVQDWGAAFFLQPVYKRTFNKEVSSSFTANMKFCYSLISLVFASLVTSTSAPVVSNNPNIIAVADFPAGGSPDVKGAVVFTAVKGLVNIHVDISGMPSSGGPFVYHIHENPVPDSKDCDGTGLHLNPYNASPICDDQLDNSYCQVGDLSGKHGTFNSTCFETTYVDPYLSLDYNSVASIIGKSVVFHFANLTKIACSNIKVASRTRTNDLLQDYKENNPEQYTKLYDLLNSSDTTDHEVEEIDETFNTSIPSIPVSRSPSLNNTNLSSFSNLSNFSGQVGDSPDCEENLASGLSLPVFTFIVSILGIMYLLF